ncbi:MAG: hypothetical protein NT068_01530, partial [Candidatus Nomurabacteria bacterium]|nr:hypothetical protein [Candidatus Nomurabacteria bacterium]
SNYGGGPSNWAWSVPYTGTSVANNIYSTAIIDTPLVPTTYYVYCNSAVGGPALQSTIIVTPTTGIVPDSILKVRVFENGNVTNTAISTADTVAGSNNTSPVATPINILSGHSVSISWAADKLPDTINPNQCWADVSTGSSTNPWVWGPPAYTGTSITPNLVWSTSIIDTPTVPTIYYVSCHTIGGPWITAGVLVTPVPPPVTSCQIPASAGGSLSGYAWSPNIGWINMNSLVYDASGNLTGYAWSPNVGWIQFGNLSGFPTNMPGSVLANAKIDSNGDLSGWARVWSMTYTAPDHESFEWASGWIDLSNTILGYHPHFNLSGTGTNLGLGSGYAWGSRVTGWVNFSGVTVAPCLNPIASVLIKVIDNSVATNITSVTASSPGTNPNTGALTLGSNNTGVKIFWGASNVDYASCTASSSTSSGWAWSNPSNHATLTLLGGPVNDIPTSTITYTVICNSLGSNTPVTANIKVNITATDPRAPRLHLSPNVNNCGDDTNKFPVSWAGNNLDQAGQCTATYTPITMPLNGWNSSVAYSSSPTYVLFPTNPTNNPVTYTLTLDCPSATGINPSSASDTQSVIIQPARNCVVEPTITSFAGNSCVVTGTDGNSVSSNIYVTSSNMSSCDVVDAVHGNTVTIPSGNGTANVNVFVNSVFKLNCTGTNGIHYANSSFSNLHDVIIPWRDICVPTAPIIHPAPKFIER